MAKARGIMTNFFEMGTVYVNDDIYEIVFTETEVAEMGLKNEELVNIFKSDEAESFVFGHCYGNGVLQDPNCNYDESPLSSFDLLRIMTDDWKQAVICEER